MYKVGGRADYLVLPMQSLWWPSRPLNQAEYSLMVLEMPVISRSWRWNCGCWSSLKDKLNVTFQLMAGAHWSWSCFNLIEIIVLPSVTWLLWELLVGIPGSIRASSYECGCLEERRRLAVLVEILIVRKGEIDLISPAIWLVNTFSSEIS